MNFHKPFRQLSEGFFVWFMRESSTHDFLSTAVSNVKIGQVKLLGQNGSAHQLFDSAGQALFPSAAIGLGHLLLIRSRFLKPWWRQYELALILLDLLLSWLAAKSGRPD